MASFLNLGSVSKKSDQPVQELTEGMLNSVFDQVNDMKDAVGETVKNYAGDVKVAAQDGGTKGVLGKISGDVDKAADAADRADQYMKKNHYMGNRSIVARSRNSIMQFPIYVTQTLRVNEAQIIAKMFERVYATLVQSVIAQNAVVEEDDFNGLKFLTDYHTNLKEAADTLVNMFYQPIDELDAMMQESVCHRVQLNDNTYLEFKVIPTTDKNLIAENALLMNDPLSGLFMYTEEKETTEQHDTKAEEVNVSDEDLQKMARNLLEDEDPELVKRLDIDDEKIKADASKKYPMPTKPASSADQDTKDNYDKARAEMTAKRADYIKDELDKRKEARDAFDKKLSDLKDDIKAGKLAGGNNGRIKYDEKSGRYTRTKVSTNKTTRTVNKDKDTVAIGPKAPVLLKDADIKKINGMLPYSIDVTLHVREKNGSSREAHIILGVKSVMHLVYAQDLSDDLRELVTGNIRSLQKVRYKTGEINFMNYFFNIKNLKADALKRTSYNKRWINTLKRLAEYSKANGSYLKKPAEWLTDGEIPIPNGTLILTQSDVTTLANQTGIDLSIVSNAKRLAKSLFLISVVIVDSSAGSMRVLFPDTDVDWDVQSLASIDAEVSKTDNSQLMKELNRLVNH